MSQPKSDSKTRFRPCIDLHQGQVKQIVGGTLTEDGATENHVSPHPSTWFAELFRSDDLTGGHVIKLGPANDAAACAALAAWPGGMQIGGGINFENAAQWIDAGASHVIVTSWLFDDTGCFQEDNARRLAAAIGRDRIVIDLSCRQAADGWTVAMNRWQTLTDLDVTHATMDRLSQYCDEFLIHAADVEGKCDGIDDRLVELIGRWGEKPVTYAGGVASQADLDAIATLSGGLIDVTVGSALDIFGSDRLQYRDLVNWNRR